MRLLRFFTEEGSIHLGIRRGSDVLDLGAKSPIELMNGTVPAPVRTISLEGLRLDAPIRDCPKMLALAGNYRKHIVEAGFDDVADTDVLTPQVFWKPNTTINSPGGAITIRGNNVFVDWEIELGVVIGRRTKDATAASAMSFVFGYTIINDVSERKFNSKIANRKLREFDPFFDWLMGKWFDGHAPMGPEIVTADEIPDPHDLALRLWVNDELMQDSRTSAMIFRIPGTIAHISSVMTLEPGDVIAMGTPSGTGSARGIALKPGDRMRGEIDGIGVLESVIQ
jgi:2-keto-4-pentenoate hydratase/2-oxohepta-3-ene-1,7-dioic acid hydratase in catechol pathway